MKRYEEIGEAFIFLLGDCSKKRKREIKSALENYVFEKRKKDDVPHPNSLEVNGCDGPSNYIEAILKIMHPYYNAHTANNVRKYIVENL